MTFRNADRVQKIKTISNDHSVVDSVHNIDAVSGDAEMNM
jgi:hypothetical protein